MRDRSIHRARRYIRAQEDRTMTKRFRAWFVNELGHEFSKDFESGEEMERFIERAADIGTVLTGFISIA